MPSYVLDGSARFTTVIIPAFPAALSAYVFRPSAGLMGDEERYIPVILAPKFEKLLSNSFFLKSMGSRLLVTEAAYQTIQNIDREYT